MESRVEFKKNCKAIIKTEMIEIGQEELRILQMQILDYVDDFCRRNDVKYTLSGGSLLGAVRHGGYIPWDDDVDIQMLRSEYNRFTTLWNNASISHPFELVNIESGNNMGYPFGKIHNPKTVILVDGLERTGVFIDVFPVDDVVDEDDFISRRAKIVRLLHDRSLVFEHMKNKGRRKSLKSLLKHLFIKLPKKSYNEIAVEINDLAKQNSTGGHDTVFEMVAGMRCNSPIPAEVFNTYTDMAFEDRKYMTVSDYDTYLTLTFGDYMTLPPEEKRVSPHGYKSFWK